MIFNIFLWNVFKSIRAIAISQNKLPSLGFLLRAHMSLFGMSHFTSVRLNMIFDLE